MYQKFDKERSKFDLGKVNWQKYCDDPDPNVSVKHFLKIVNKLNSQHAPFKS